MLSGYAGAWYRRYRWRDLGELRRRESRDNQEWKVRRHWISEVERVLEWQEPPRPAYGRRAPGAKDYELLGIDTHVQKTMAANPRRVAAIVMELDVRVSAQATDQDLKVLERVARACPVAQSLHPDLKQDLMFRFVRA